MDEQMIELIARALCEADGRDPEYLEPGDEPYGDRTVVDLSGCLPPLLVLTGVPALLLLCAVVAQLTIYR